jgi:hypothetical protein
MILGGVMRTTNPNKLEDAQLTYTVTGNFFPLEFPVWARKKILEGSVNHWTQLTGTLFARYREHGAIEMLSTVRGVEAKPTMLY